MQLILSPNHPGAVYLRHIRTGRKLPTGKWEEKTLRFSAAKPTEVSDGEAERIREDIDKLLLRVEPHDAAAGETEKDEPTAKRPSRRPKRPSRRRDVADDSSEEGETTEATGEPGAV